MVSLDIHTSQASDSIYDDKRDSLMDQNLVTLYVTFRPPQTHWHGQHAPQMQWHLHVHSRFCQDDPVHTETGSTRRLRYGGIVKGNGEIHEMSRRLKVGRLGCRIIMGPDAEVHGLIYRWQSVGGNREMTFGFLYGGGGGGGIDRSCTTSGALVWLGKGDHVWWCWGLNFDLWLYGVVRRGS